MPVIPAICLNPYCLCIFGSGIFIENCTNITVSNSLSGPCPSCGSMGRIPNAIYNADASKIWATVLTLADLNILKKALHTIERHFHSEKFNPSALKDDLEKDIPELKTLFDALPKTRTELYSFINIIGTSILVACAVWAALRGTPIINVNVGGALNSPPALSAPQQESHNEKKNKQATPKVIKA